MCPLKDSSAFHGPSGFVPLGRPAALPAGWGSAGVDHVNGSGGSRAGGGTPRARRRTSRVRHSHPRPHPGRHHRADGTDRAHLPAQDCATSTTWPESALPARPPAINASCRTAVTPMRSPPALHCQPEPIRQRRTLETTRPEGHPHAHSGEPHHHKPPTYALRLRRSTPALQPGPDSTNNTKPQVKSLTWGSKRAAFGIRTRDLRITRACKIVTVADL
jgi:hypothetical protein